MEEKTQDYKPNDYHNSVWCESRFWDWSNGWKWLSSCSLWGPAKYISM